MPLTILYIAEADPMAAVMSSGVLARMVDEAPDARFTRRLSAAGFQVEEVGVRARSNGKGPRHVIWFARAP